MTNKQLITTILDELGIDYWTEGKNVSEGAVNINCPFFDCDDPSDHMGIFEDSLVYHCWKCRRKGPFSYLLTILTGKSRKECEDMIAEVSGSNLDEVSDPISEASNSWQVDKSGKNEKSKVSPLPKYFEKVRKGINYPLLYNYLKRRNIPFDLIIEKGCGVCRVGPYMNRLITPVTFEGKQVSFVAADMTGKAHVKYLYPGSQINEYLYGYDDIEVGCDILIVVEGLLDAWAAKDSVVSIFGTYLTDTQKSLILKKKPKTIVFCLDGDAYWHALDEAKFFEPYSEQVVTIHMPFEEDPDSLGTDEIWKAIEAKLSEDLDLV